MGASPGSRQAFVLLRRLGLFRLGKSAAAIAGDIAESRIKTKPILVPWEFVATAFYVGRFRSDSGYWNNENFGVMPRTLLSQPFAPV